MSTPPLVREFYERLWNAGDLDATAELLDADFKFRGSLGDELRGRDAFGNYARAVRSALAEYRCEVLDCVAEGDRAFARMRFSGVQIAQFRGFAPTGQSIAWEGAALFRFHRGTIAELWVLGDLQALDAALAANAAGGNS